MSWWSVALQALGSAFTDDGSETQSRRTSRDNRWQAEMEAAQQRNTLMYARQLDLEDRRYKEEVMNRYSGRGGFGQSTTAPVFTDTTPSQIALPQPVQQQQTSGRNRNRNRNQNQGLMYFT